jgi:hypothetical protein
MPNMNMMPGYMPTMMPASVPHLPKPSHQAGSNSNATAHGSKGGQPNFLTEGGGAMPYQVERQAVPFGVSHRGFVNHYQHSYRYRVYPRQRNNTSQLQAQLQHLITLKADLDTLAQAGQQPTQKQKDLLHRDLLAVVEKGASKPPTDPAKSLSNSLADLVAQKKKHPLDTERLVYSLDVVMNSPLATPSEVGFAISSGQSVLSAAGLNRADVAALAGHLKAVAVR